MAIKAGDLQFRTMGGRIIVSGQLNNLFPNGTTSAGIAYAALEVRNLNETLTLSSVKAWLTEDSRGGSFAIAYDSGSGIVPATAAWDDVDPTSLTYLSPATFATGITLGNLTPASKARIFCRRVLSGASVANPESNRVWVGGSSPL